MKTVRLSLLVIACLVSVVALAQDATAYPVPADQSQALAIALFSALLPFLVSGIRKLRPTMPRIVVWTLPPFLGALIAWLTNLGGLSGWQGLAAGLGAIALREGVSTLQEHGLNG